MGADPRTDDARWLLDWINRTGRSQFSRRDAHQAEVHDAHDGGVGPVLAESVRSWLDEPRNRELVSGDRSQFD